MKNTFKAFVIYEDKTCKITNMNFSELMEGNVLIKIHYTSFNYKDGLAIVKKIPIIKKFPMIPGVDFSGSVEESGNSKFKKRRQLQNNFFYYWNNNHFKLCGYQSS